MCETLRTLGRSAAATIRACVSWRLLFPVVLGVLFALGDDVVSMEGRLHPTRLTLYCKMGIFAAMFCLMFILAERLILILGEHEREKTLEPAHRTPVMFDWTPVSVGIGACGIALCWLPYLIFQYPGVYWSDTSRQLVMYYGGEPVMDQHPFFDTYLFGWFADLGQLLFSDRVIGLYLLIVVQALAMAVLFALSASYIRRIGAPRWLCWTTYAIVALLPVFPVMFASLAKDTVNALFLLPFTMMMAETARTRGDCLRRPWLAALFAADALLVCLTKKTGVYIVVVALLALCLLRMGRRLRAMLAALAVALLAVMFVVIPQCVFPVLGVEPGGKQEMIPFVAQQLARDLKYDGDTFSEEDRRIIDGFFEYDSEQMGERYEPFSADAVKGMYSRDGSSLGDVLGLWLRKTVEHPVGHLEAWIDIAQGWISFRQSDGEPNYLVVYYASNWYDERVMDYMEWPQENPRNLVVQSVYETVRSVPVVNVLYYRSFWATVVPFFLCYLAFGLRGRRRSEGLAMLSPLLTAMATLFIAGVSGMGGEPTRYVFSLMVMAPVVCGVLLRGDGDGAGGGSGGVGRRV